MPHCNGYINHSQSRCQTCVPHVTCFPLLSCPYLVFLFLSSLVPSCVWFSPHLFQFSSLLPSILKPWFSPCLMSGIECLPCFIKVNVWNSPCLLAPCSPLRERDRIPDPKTGRSVSPPSFFFPVFEKFFYFPVFPCSRGDGSRRPLHRPCPPRSAFPRVFAGVLRACRGDGIRWRHHPLSVLARGQFPSSRGPPRHQGTMLEGGDPPVSGECQGPSQNQPAVVRGSPKPANAARGSSLPAGKEYGKPNMP